MLVTEIVHLSALAPLGVVLVLHALRRPVSGRWWLLAGAFAVSWVGDSLAYYLGGSFTASYFWLPVQFALVLAAFPPKVPPLLWGVSAFVACGLLSLASAQLSWPGPDGLLTLVASIAVLAVATDVHAVPVWVYFGAGSLAYLTMVAEMEPRPSAFFYDIRAAYHTLRLVAYATFGVLAVWEGVWAHS